MKILWLLLVLLSAGSACQADRDIVYAARYYTPPGSHRTSHFHIYRINPNGTGKTQLTFGTADDYNPVWSVNGREVLFTEYIAALDQTHLYEMSANGGRRHLVKILPGITSTPFLVVSEYRLYAQYDQAQQGSDQLPDKAILVNLKTGKRLTLHLPTNESVCPQIGDLLPVPQTTHTVIYEQDIATSGTRPENAYYLIDTLTGKMTKITEGQFLTWSPGSTSFCTAEARHLADYGKPIDGYQKSLYVAALQIGQTSNGQLKQITPRLSYVTGADWRKVK